MRVDRDQRRHEDGIIRNEAEVLELAREVLGRVSTRLDDCSGPFFRARLTTQSDDTEDDERSY